MSIFDEGVLIFFYFSANAEVEFRWDAVSRIYRCDQPRIYRSNQPRIYRSNQPRDSEGVCAWTQRSRREIVRISHIIIVLKIWLTTNKLYIIVIRDVTEYCQSKCIQTI